MRRGHTIVTVAAVVATIAALVLPGAATASGSHSASGSRSARGLPRVLGGARYGRQGWPRCPTGPTLTEIYATPQVKGCYYTGHDEPSVLFYSGRSGAGNDMLYRLTLPKDAQVGPGSGGTENFQLHPAFWFGMAMCDNQSAPNPGGSSVGPNIPCTRDSDANIYNSSDPLSPRYIGRHPGTAFMEMQFYPPGWIAWPPGDSCSGTKWCAALNIDSYSLNMNRGVANNPECLSTVGIEPVNFAFITKNGVAQAPANPVDATAATYTPDPTKDLFMSSGDRIQVHMYDTKAGFKVVIRDLTTGQSGSMTASVANRFGEVNYQPLATTCSVTLTAFHPEYATSSPNTRVPWAAHSYNVAFADEIGHFEYCDPGAIAFGSCFSSTRTDFDGTDADDNACFPASDSTHYQVNGCYGADIDFDGTPYLRDWPGTFSNTSLDAKLHPRPIRFTSPILFSGGKIYNYARVAFEADLPRIEGYTTPTCHRHLKNPADPHPGFGCVNPPAGAAFYPYFTTTGKGTACQWQLGGGHIPGTVNLFGGSSAKEFGTRASGNLLALFYPDVKDRTDVIYEDFRHILSSNPCPAKT